VLGSNPFGLAARQSAVLDETTHRPWPLPDGDWFLAQTWESLLFAHWRVPVAAVEAAIPPAIDVDLFDGEAWLGITPFRLSGLRVRGLPPVPFVSAFPELNVRTYVTVGGKPGIFFLSLDTPSSLAVVGARRAYKLPYFHARTSMRRAGSAIEFESVRTQEPTHPRAFRVRYRAVAPAFEPRPGSLEYFLTERYRLYTVAGGHLYLAEIHHARWRISPASALIEENTMVPTPITFPRDDPLLHVAEPQDTLIWPLRQAEAASSDSATRT
jgi:uncharacterized protein